MSNTPKRTYPAALPADSNVKQFPQKRKGRGAGVTPTSSSPKVVSIHPKPLTSAATKEVIEQAVLRMTKILYTRDISHQDLNIGVIAILESLIAHRVSLVLHFEKPDHRSTRDSFDWLEDPDDKVFIFNLIQYFLATHISDPKFPDILKRFSVALRLYPVNLEQLIDLGYTA